MRILFLLGKMRPSVDIVHTFLERDKFLIYRTGLRHKNRFLPNFSPIRSGKPTALGKNLQAPFDGRSFGKDAMAGGAPLSGFNRFTLYTPNTAAIIQRFPENKAVFDSDSPTGFSKWNPDTSRMEPFRHRINLGRETTAPVNDLSEGKLASLLAESDLVKVAMGDGNWTKNIPLPPASPANPDAPSALIIKPLTTAS